ncbi:MAG: dihydrolipoyl dehydrogenase [Methanosarcinales archaeon]|nr:dihydrolipoyl dehydrogenase [Methanosarcinales archaeon]
MAEEFDFIVIGSGAGLIVASRAYHEGRRVALLEHGPMGGTCLNVGCIPSKILIYPADVVRTLQDASRIGVHGSIDRIDFPLIMKRMRALVDGECQEIARSIRSEEGFTWFDQTGEFVADYTIRTGDKEITAPRILIASGARALIPPLPGLKEAGYLDNVSVFHMQELPESLIILGGGYIACEFGHFFSAMGTEVTVLGRSPLLLKSEDREISETALRAMSRYMNIHTSHEAVRVESSGGKKVVHAVDRSTGQEKEFSAGEILVATGRRSNADLLRPEKTGVETDKKGWIRVNEYLETTKPGIWALGDAIGRHMFRHTANYEAGVVWKNAFTEEKVPVDFHAVPHAVFSHPPVAGVGMTEAEALAAGYDIYVGRATYADVAKGYAMGEEDTLAKAIVDAATMKILGFHVIGSSSPDLVQQVVFLMNTDDQDYMPLARSQVIHPALSEVVVRAFGNLEHVHHHEPGHDDDDHGAGDR